MCLHTHVYSVNRSRGPLPSITSYLALHSWRPQIPNLVLMVPGRTRLSGRLSRPLLPAFLLSRGSLTYCQRCWLRVSTLRSSPSFPAPREMLNPVHLLCVAQATVVVAKQGPQHAGFASSLLVFSLFKWEGDSSVSQTLALDHSVGLGGLEVGAASLS